ncbi:MAG: lipopolysaccharide biosynthesis protein [Bacteroidetes bacterium]|nr:MAG: lipopolysaccharide biosynthesis protein [Bacteroidota bacterium]
MSTPTIQRQSIFSAIIIVLGFGFGALNILFLQKLVLSAEQWGLTRVIAESALLLSSFATLGMPMIAGKFLPFYNRYLPAGQNDLPFHALRISLLGLLLVVAFLVVARQPTISFFGRNNPIFPPYYYALVLFTVFQSMFLFTEVYAAYAGKAVISNAIKELMFRVLTTVCLLLLWTKLVSFSTFVALFASTYLPCALLMVVVLLRAGQLRFYTRTSTVTRRLKQKMVSYGSFVMFSQISNIAFLVCDTLFLARMYNFSQAGIYAVAQYFSQVVEIPIRSTQAPSIPRLAEYWRAKNMEGIQSIYRKSCVNLLIAAMAIGGVIIVNLHNLGRFYGNTYNTMLLPLAVLVLARWINAGTGLNTIILQLSPRWRFDFYSTLIYSIIGIPLNALLIHNMGMLGAALANVIAMLLYNGVRFWFLYHRFGLQPFSWRNGGVLLGGGLVIAVIYAVPALPNLWADGICRTTLFALAYATLMVKAGLSPEVTQLWHKWSHKALHALGMGNRTAV